MKGILLIKKGSSIPFAFNRGGQDISGWILTIFVKQFPGDTAIITRVITAGVDDEGNPAWPGFITGTESDLLTEGILYYINAKLVNAANDEEEAIPVRFNIAKAWA